MCLATFIARIDQCGRRLRARPFCLLPVSLMNRVLRVFSSVYCDGERCFDDPLAHPDSRIARSSASVSVVLRTIVFGWAAFCAPSPETTVRATATGAGT